MATDIPELTAHIGYWLRQVSNHVSSSFARKLAGKKVTAAEWVLMRLLYQRAPTAPSRIAEEIGMTKGAITKLADRLITKSLIVREANSDDARAQTLRLTAKGAKFVPQLAALADENDAECFAQLPADDRKALSRILKNIVSRLDFNAMPTE
jgi:DNA-binding MarR family transcriptional regulator